MYIRPGHYTTFHMENRFFLNFYCLANQTDFHMKCCARGVTFKTEAKGNSEMFVEHPIKQNIQFSAT